MYDLTRSKFSDADEKQVYPGETIGKDKEGAILVSKMYNGDEYVMLSTGAAGEIPVGFAHPDNTQRSTRVMVTQYVMPTATNAYTYQAKPNIVAGSARVYDVTDGREIPSGAGTNSYSVNTTTGVFTIASDATNTYNVGGDTIQFTYRYNLTVLEAEILDYERAVNRKATATFNQVTCLGGEGIIYTDQFYTSNDYTGGATTDLRTGPNGMFKVGGSGSQFGRVIHAPTVALPFLGVAYNVKNAALYT